MNKENIKKGRHSRTLLPGISLLYVVNKIGKILHLVNNKKAGDPRLQHSGMTASFGFTLIELLVVVLIIGILAAIALPQYERAVMKSRFATLQPLVHALSNAAEVYYLANGEYPTQFNVLDIELPQTPTSADTEPNEKGEFFVYFPQDKKCKLTHNATLTFISCYNGNIAYTKMFDQSPYVAGARYCSALNKDSAAYGVCHSLTGYTPASANSDDIAFPFP